MIYLTAAFIFLYAFMGGYYLLRAGHEQPKSLQQRYSFLYSIMYFVAALLFLFILFSLHRLR